MKLNLGAGTRHIEGFVSVDKYLSEGVDIVHDLETFPWPWEDGSIEEIVAIHVLEHICPRVDQYRDCWREIYRVLQPGGRVTIIVPHPDHINFQDDPTHCRVVTARQFSLFDQEFNAECAKQGCSNSQLGRYWGINFKVRHVTEHPSALYLEANPAKRADLLWLAKEAATKLNQIEQTTVVLEKIA